MTRHLFTASLVVPLALVACASPGANVDLAAEQEALIAASDSIVAQEVARNTEGALAYWADDAIMHMDGSPEIVGKDGVRGVYEAMFNDTTMLAFSSSRSGTEMAPGGGLAFEHGVNRFQVQTPNGPTEMLGKYLAVWRKGTDGWKIAALAVTNDAPPAAQ